MGEVLEAHDKDIRKLSEDLREQGKRLSAEIARVLQMHIQDICMHADDVSGKIQHLSSEIIEVQQKQEQSEASIVDSIEKRFDTLQTLVQSPGSNVFPEEGNVDLGHSRGMTVLDTIETSPMRKNEMVGRCSLPNKSDFAKVIGLRKMNTTRSIRSLSPIQWSTSAPQSPAAGLERTSNTKRPGLVGLYLQSVWK